MSHGYYAGHAVDPWMIAAFIIGVAAVLGILMWFIHRRGSASDGLTGSERKTLEYPNRDILSLLRQNGGPMDQKEIIDLTPGDFNELAKAIRELELSKFITRKWNAENSTYTIEAVPVSG